MDFRIFLFGLAVSIATLFTSCTKDNETTEANLTFNFIHMVGDQHLEFDTLIYTNAFGNNYSVSTLKYFVSDFVLSRDDGSMIMINKVHYIDARDTSSLSFTADELIPGGDFIEISFSFGLADENNNSNSYINPPESLMEWPLPMGGGYHYMKLEGKFDSIGSLKNYQAHTGRLMENPHNITVKLNRFSFTVDGTTADINIIMNINQWWANPNTLDLNNISGIMGNEIMQQKLQENGASVFQGGFMKSGR